MLTVFALSPFSPTTDCRTAPPTPAKNTTTITTAATTKNLVAHRLKFPSPSSRSTQGSACATLPLLQRILYFGALLCTLYLCILLNISLYIPPPTFWYRRVRPYANSRYRVSERASERVSDWLIRYIPHCTTSANPDAHLLNMQWLLWPSVLGERV